jgi:prepilin-type N-terminal cleavage/methylation domain-containing protein
MFKNLKRSDWSDKSVAEQGFTLIELLVVIAILGILAVVGVLSFNGLTGGAHAAVNKTELTQVQSAVDAFQAANDGQAPTATLGLPGAADYTAVGTKGQKVAMSTLIKSAQLVCSGYTIDAAGNVTMGGTCP